MQILVRGPGERHDNQYHARGARSLIVELDPGTVGRAFAGEPRLVGGHALARRLVAAFRSPARAAELQGAVRAIVDALRAAPRAPAWLERTRETLLERLADPPSLDELGRAAGVHPVHLAQSFRARWGTTPRGFVRGHRVFRAIELIACGTPLARAASEVGFCDQSHMTRAVARARSAPPGALRRRIPAGH
jgi:AraC family transcriptional regulator